MQNTENQVQGRPQYSIVPASPEEAGLFYAQTQKQVIGRLCFVNGEQIEYTDPAEYLKVLREELPFHSTTGFRCETLTNAPEIRKAVDDMVCDLYGEENPSSLEEYETAPEQGMTVGVMSLRKWMRMSKKEEKKGVKRNGNQNSDSKMPELRK